MESRRMTVVVAMEPRAYREAIGGTIEALRPHVEVMIIEPEELDEAVVRLDPELVVCCRPESAVLEGRLAWVDYCPYEKPAARIRIGDWRAEVDEIGLDDLLSVLDRTKELVRSGNEPRNR